MPSSLGYFPIDSSHSGKHSNEIFILFILGRAGSSLLRAGFLQPQSVGATLHCGVGLLVATACPVTDHRL